MLPIGRLLLLLAACLSLSSCQLIGTALRLAPYLLMFAEEEQGQGKSGQMQHRAQEIERKGHFAPQQRWMPAAADSQMAAATPARRAASAPAVR